MRRRRPIERGHVTTQEGRQVVEDAGESGLRRLRGRVLRSAMRRGDANSVRHGRPCRPRSTSGLFAKVRSQDGLRRITSSSDIVSRGSRVSPNSCRAITTGQRTTR